MTRINVIPPELMLDEWVAGHCREGLRPINNLRNGKYRNKPYGGKYRLGQGHELWGAFYGKFTSEIWKQYKVEWVKRGKHGFDFDPSITDYPESYKNDYIPTKEDYLVNIERLKERFSLRSKPYHFKGKKVDTDQEFNEWLNMVYKELGL